MRRYPTALRPRVVSCRGQELATDGERWAPPNWAECVRHPALLRDRDFGPSRTGARSVVFRVAMRARRSHRTGTSAPPPESGPGAVRPPLHPPRSPGASSAPRGRQGTMGAGYGRSKPPGISVLAEIGEAIGWAGEYRAGGGDRGVGWSGETTPSLAISKAWRRAKPKKSLSPPPRGRGSRTASSLGLLPTISR